MPAFTGMAQKSAVIYSKTGPAIYHSHHDMIRFWERAVKRAALPVRMTGGFNPRPRIVFPHALGLGITSLHEEVELEFHTGIARRELLDRLMGAAGDTLAIRDAVNLPPVKKSRQIVASGYSITGWTALSRDKLPGAVDAILSMTEIPVERGAPDSRRTMDIRPYLRELRYEEAGGALRLGLAHTQAGSARPDEIAKLAAGMTGMDHHDLGIEKTSMRLE
ncbi:MAG: TIGR03936 family radical SAM-associated protein [Planctomycetota bacterium]|jgi:radical SAM-linked protein|nr:TIGR03936 family radical SAM-associated protein [Planctomycetota bacterium]